MYLPQVFRSSQIDAHCRQCQTDHNVDSCDDDKVLSRGHTALRLFVHTKTNVFISANRLLAAALENNVAEADRDHCDEAEVEGVEILQSFKSLE